MTVVDVRLLGSATIPLGAPDCRLDIRVSLLSGRPMLVFTSTIGDERTLSCDAGDLLANDASQFAIEDDAIDVGGGESVPVKVLRNRGVPLTIAPLSVAQQLGDALGAIDDRYREILSAHPGGVTWTDDRAA